MLEPEGHGQCDHVKIARNFFNQGDAPVIWSSVSDRRFLQALFALYFKAKNADDAFFPCRRVPSTFRIMSFRRGRLSAAMAGKGIRMINPSLIL
jgi:hypothetical protein